MQNTSRRGALPELAADWPPEQHAELAALLTRFPRQVVEPSSGELSPRSHQSSELPEPLGTPSRFGPSPSRGYRVRAERACRRGLVSSVGSNPRMTDRRYAGKHE